MSDTTNLGLPWLAPGQAQKHITVNESLQRLDALVQLSVVSAATTAEPGSPTDGQVWIMPSGKSGAHWASFANGSLAYYRDGAWEQITPREGWLALVKDVDQLVYYTGSAWSLFPAGKLVVVSATDKVLGRATSGAGAAEEIACTAAGRALIDDADATAQRATLGLGTAATQNTGTTGANVPLLNGNLSWSGLQTLSRADPAYIWTNTSGGVDEKSWVMSAYSAVNGEFHLSAKNDAFSAGADAMYIVRSGYSIAHVNFGAPVRPFPDNTHALGAASLRWSVVYAGTGTINTSDAREKTSLQPLPAGVRRAILRVLGGVGAFQWLEAREQKGEAARLHVGVTAQAVRDAFSAEGEDPARWAMFCADGDGVGGERLSLRMDQLLLAMISVIAGGEAQGSAT